MKKIRNIVCVIFAVIVIVILTMLFTGVFDKKEQDEAAGSGGDAEELSDYINLSEEELISQRDYKKNENGFYPSENEFIFMCFDNVVGGIFLSQIHEDNDKDYTLFGIAIGDAYDSSISKLENKFKEYTTYPITDGNRTVFIENKSSFSLMIDYNDKNKIVAITYSNEKIEDNSDSDDTDESEAKNNDISAAKTIYTNVSTALGNENIWNEIIDNHVNELIIFSEQGLSILEDKTKEEILEGYNALPTVRYTANGAEHFAFEVDQAGNICVYVCNSSNTKKWQLVPEVDSEYDINSNGNSNLDTEEPQTEEVQTEEVQTEAPYVEELPDDLYVIQIYQAYVGETMVKLNLEYSGITGYMALFYDGASEPEVYEIYKSGDAWYSYDGIHTISYLENGNVMISSSTYDLPYAGEFEFVSQSVY